MTEEYKGVTISYSEGTDIWSCDDEGVTEEASSLKGLKGKIDKNIKTNFKRIPVFYKSWRSANDGLYQSGMITSFVKTSGRVIEAWVANENKNREKICLDSLITDTEENRKKIAEIEKLEKERQAIKKSIKNIQSSLICVKDNAW